MSFRHHLELIINYSCPARLGADQKKAKTYYAKLIALCRRADSMRPEIEEAKAFLGGVNVKNSASHQ